MLVIYSQVYSRELRAMRSNGAMKVILASNSNNMFVCVIVNVALPCTLDAIELNKHNEIDAHNLLIAHM